MLQIKRVYAPVMETDGQRILVDRLWARGRSKEQAALTDWAKAIAPSTTIRQQFGHDPNQFPTFVTAYTAELAVNPATPKFIEQVATGLEQGNVTLVYGAKDELHNNAVVLKAYLLTQLPAKLTKVTD
ncbi:DUF488 domain-containing protein [Furfurilactobacillus sp. WILCCON 0119]